MCAFSECFLFEMFHLLDSNTQIYLDKNFFLSLLRISLYTCICLLHLHEIMEGLYFQCSLSMCLSVCVCVYVSDSACEQNSSGTDAPIWTRVSLNGCSSHWLRPY